MKPIGVKMSVLMIFNSLCRHYDRTYCWPTRAKIQEMLLTRYGLKASLSWIDDCLGWLNRNRYVVSYQNYGTNADGTKYNKPSNRMLTKKTVTMLISCGIKIAQKIYYATRSSRGHGKDQKPPGPKTPSREMTPVRRSNSTPLLVPS